jgi:hypothetical protein
MNTGGLRGRPEPGGPGTSARIGGRTGTRARHPAVPEWD